MKNKYEGWIVIIALLAMAAKLYCAATTIGTIDVGLYYRFAKFIAEHDVITIYSADPTFNHPPLLGNYLGLAFEWAGGKPPRFAFFHRLPGIVADLVVVLIFLQLRRRIGKPNWWALGVLAASPISFMVSGYHGNYDPLIALGLTLAAAACLYQCPALCGVFLGLTCQVKIIPLLLAPALFFFWWHRGRNRAGAFGAAAAATVLIGWSGPLIGAPDTFLKHVLAYNSTWGWWGFSYLLNVSGIPAFGRVSSAFAANAMQGAVIDALKLIIIAGALLIAWRRRKCEEDGIFATISVTWAVFLFFAPGFGVQYLAWVSPFFLGQSERWLAIYTGAASAALFAFYHTISGSHFPWLMGSRMESLMGIWRPWLLLPWGVFGIYLVREWRVVFGMEVAGREEREVERTSALEQ